MKTTEKPAFVIIITALAEAFNRKATEPLLLGYWMGLGDLEFAAVEHAAARAMVECKFMPVPAELRQLAGGILPADRAALAWEAFIKALQLHGCYVSVDFDDKLINATVRNLGGWLQVDERLEQDGDIWVRKDFERVYQAFLRTGVSTSQALALGGIHESNNLLNGYEVKSPCLVLTGLPPHREGVIALPSPVNPLPAGLLEGTLRPAE